MKIISILPSNFTKTSLEYNEPDKTFAIQERKIIRYRSRN